MNSYVTPEGEAFLRSQAVILVLCAFTVLLLLISLGIGLWQAVAARRHRQLQATQLTALQGRVQAVEKLLSEVG